MPAKLPTEIKSLARSHSRTAIATLAGIMRQKTAPPAARVMACKEILERGYGKAEVSQELSASIQVTIRTLIDPQAQPLTINGSSERIEGRTVENAGRTAEDGEGS